MLTGFLFLTSCVLDQNRDNFGEGPVIVQFQKATANQSFVQKGTNELTNVKAVIESFGGDNLPTTSDITVTIAVSTVSEAKEGVDVIIPNKTVTIPAGKNAADLILQVNADKLTVGTPKKLVLEIVSSSQVISDGKGKMTITLNAICESNLAGSYTYTTGSKKSVTVTSNGTGTYMVNRDNAFNADYAFTFSDNCGVLTVTGGDLSGMGYPVSGSGTVNTATGDITIIYTVNGQFPNRTMVMKKN